MSSILRHASAFARQLVLSLCLFGLLASPFGVRTYLDVQAAQRAAAAQHLDGLALTIEQNWDDSSIEWYLGGIRRGIDGAVGLGDHYLLVASTFPVPSEHRSFPWAAMSRYCQVFAPMAYWRATGQRQFLGGGGGGALLGPIFSP